MGNVYFFTGFPGFISKELIKELIEKDYDISHIYVLALSGTENIAEDTRKQLLADRSFPQERFHIVVGDITKDMLDIDEDTQKKLQSDVTHVYHLAAIYDLAVAKDIAYKVNVTGTKHVNDWVRTLKNIQRYTYFSTAYVAGKREGLLLETELLRPDSFKNYYEETKFEAEVLVEELKDELPVTIIRPGIVKGHSKTGETVKFDGPYMILNMLYKLRKSPLFPLIGSGETTINLVPIDFIVKGTLYLSHAQSGIGKTYHLADPNPYKVKDIYELFLQEMLNKKPKGKIPLAAAKPLLAVSSVRKALRTEKEVLDYFTWNARFDCSVATKDLSEAGIQCPDFKDQVPSMVKFYLENENNKNYHIIIR